MFRGTCLKNRPQACHLDGVPVVDENLLFVNVEVDGRDDGEVGRRPLVEVDDELEGDVGQLLADGGEHKGAVGGEAEEGAVEGAEDAAAGRQAVGGLGAEAAAHPVAQRALLVRLALARVALDQVAPEAAAAPRAVAVPEQLLGLQERWRGLNAGCGQSRGTLSPPVSRGAPPCGPCSGLGAGLASRQGGWNLQQGAGGGLLPCKRDIGSTPLGCQTTCSLVFIGFGPELGTLIQLDCRPNHSQPVNV